MFLIDNISIKSKKSDIIDMYSEDMKLLLINDLDSKMYTTNLQMLKLEMYAFKTNNIALYNEGIGEWIVTAIEWIRDKIKAFISWIGGIIKKILDFFSGKESTESDKKAENIIENSLDELLKRKDISLKINIPSSKNGTFKWEKYVNNIGKLISNLRDMNISDDFEKDYYEKKFNIKNKDDAQNYVYSIAAGYKDINKKVELNDIKITIQDICDIASENENFKKNLNSMLKRIDDIAKTAKRTIDEKNIELESINKEINAITGTSKQVLANKRAKEELRDKVAENIKQLNIFIKLVTTTITILNSLSSIRKACSNKIVSLENLFKAKKYVNEEYKAAIESNDTSLARDYICNALEDEKITYYNLELIISDFRNKFKDKLFEKHDGIELDKPNGHKTRSQLSDAVIGLKNNFSEKRLKNAMKIITFIYERNRVTKAKFE